MTTKCSILRDHLIYATIHGSEKETGPRNPTTTTLLDHGHSRILRLLGLGWRSGFWEMLIQNCRLIWWSVLTSYNMAVVTGYHSYSSSQEVRTLPTPEIGDRDPHIQIQFQLVS